MINFDPDRPPTILSLAYIPLVVLGTAIGFILIIGLLR